MMGYQLPRRVASTTFTEEAGIAGKDVLTIPLASLLYDGVSNWGLRFISSGQRGFFVMSRNYRESVLLYSLIAALRDQDLEVIISQYSRTKDQPYSTQDEKKIATQKFAQHMVDHMANVGPQKAQETLANRIKELEAENTKLLHAKVLHQPPMHSARADPFQQEYEALRRTADQDKFLGKSAPTTSKAREVGLWVKKTAGKKADVDSICHKFTEFFDKRSQEQKISDTDILRTIAIEWGMPFGLAATMDAKTTIRVLAAVQAAHK